MYRINKTNYMKINLIINRAGSGTKGGTGYPHGPNRPSGGKGSRKK